MDKNQKKVNGRVSRRKKQKENKKEDVELSLAILLKSV